MGQNLWNLPDLILLAFLGLNGFLGMKHGVLYSCCSLVGRLISTAAAALAARTVAPVLTEKAVIPLIGETLGRRMEQISLDSLPEGLRETVAAAVAGMAESIAFAFLLVLFGLLFGWLTGLAILSLRAVARKTPLGILDRLAGGAAGVVTGLLLAALVLLCLAWFAPAIYSEAGWLSPQTVAGTVLLVRLAGLLQVVF